MKLLVGGLGRVQKKGSLLDGCSESGGNPLSGDLNEPYVKGREKREEQNLKQGKRSSRTCSRQGGSWPSARCTATLFVSVRRGRDEAVLFFVSPC